jgi:outer membrane lipoprotein-sorting protein
MNEKEEKTIGEIFRHAMPDDLPAAVAERLQRRLTAFREQFDAVGSKPPKPERLGFPITRWIGGLTMRQRITMGGVGVAAVLGLVLLWIGTSGNPVSAMERMAENIRQAKSWKATMTMETQFVREPGKPPVTSALTATVYWLAPNSYWMELRGRRDAVQDATNIFPAGKPGIHLDHKAKKQDYPLIMLDKLGRFSGEADRKLGSKQINGKKAWGFEIDGKKIDPDAYPGPVEIWLDTQSNLPVSLRYEMKSPVMPAPMIIQMKDFQWNIDLAPELFQAEAPNGYTEQPKSEAEFPPPEKVLKGIIVALKTYAEFCGGHYPRTTRSFAEPVRDEMYKAAGKPYPARTLEELRDKTYQKLHDAEQGFAVFNRVFMFNPDVAYYGKTVGPNDRDKVLLRWKLDDGRYQVIFGDLRSEAVTVERLRALEGK